DGAIEMVRPGDVDVEKSHERLRVVGHVVDETLREKWPDAVGDATRAVAPRADKEEEPGAEELLALAAQRQMHEREGNGETDGRNKQVAARRCLPPQPQPPQEAGLRHARRIRGITEGDPRRLLQLITAKLRRVAIHLHEALPPLDCVFPTDRAGV